MSTSSRTAHLAYTLSLVPMLLLTGCDHVRLALGMRTSLAKVSVMAMEPSLPQGSAIAPGQSSPLMVTFTDAKGKVWTTEGAGHGKIQWRDITVTPTVVTAKKGIISLRHDPRATLGKTGELSITLPSHPTVAPATLAIPLTYAYPFVAAYYGPSGSNGTDGSNGSDGSSGSSGSTDPDNPSAGGNGGDGSAGGDGSNGTDGGDAPSVQAWVTLMPGSQAHPLLQVRVLATGTSTAHHAERFYLLDAQGGSLTIKSDGGSGGRGGAGGKGGSGGSGGSGIPSGSNGSSGSNGNSGSDGSDGSNGPVAVTYDPQVKPFLTNILVNKRDASSITFTEAPVAALW